MPKAHKKPNDLDEAEKYFIRKLDSFHNGYNQTPDGQGNPDYVRTVARTSDEDDYMGSDPGISIPIEPRPDEYPDKNAKSKTGRTQPKSNGVSSDETSQGVNSSGHTSLTGEPRSLEQILKQNHARMVEERFKPRATSNRSQGHQKEKTICEPVKKKESGVSPSHGTSIKPVVVGHDQSAPTTNTQPTVISKNEDNKPKDTKTQHRCWFSHNVGDKNLII